MKSVFFDNNSTTACDPQVVEAMLPFFTQNFGNPSSQSHSYGWQASSSVDKAKRSLGKIAGCETKGVIFTSGATESIHLALHGVLENFKGKKAHIISSRFEHDATLQNLESLKEQGFQVTLLKGNSYGQIEVKEVLSALTPETVLVSLMMANNEIGSLTDVASIGKVLNDKKVLFHVDAAQCFGKYKIDMKEMNIDFLSASAHKVYGPKGAGALFIQNQKNDLELVPVIIGGGQQGGVRAGTLNVPGIIGLQKAVEIANENLELEKTRVGTLRDKIWKEIKSFAPEVKLNGHPTERLYNNLNMTFPGLKSDLMSLMDFGLAFSSSSACSSGQPEGSHVLTALGVPQSDQKNTMRLGLGRFTTEAEVDTCLGLIRRLIEKNREISEA